MRRTMSRLHKYVEVKKSLSRYFLLGSFVTSICCQSSIHLPYLSAFLLILICVLVIFQNCAVTFSAVESAPKPAVRRSLQMIPDAVSHSSSRSSVHVSDEAAQNGVHVFKTSDGGFWYHFSDNERGRSRSTGNTIPRRESTGGVSPLAPRSETIPRTPPKKPPRSRSSSAASRNEVHFSSIPQLHSHPDDRFGVEVSGEPFRPASEHELTPHAQKIGSRSDVTAADETSTQKPQEAVVDLDSGMMTVPVHEKANSEVSSNVMNPPSRTPSLKSVDSIPSPLVVTDALTPKRAPYELKDDEDYNSPASFNRTLFSREAFQRRRFREPERAEVAIQTGETIRLRQGMSFEEEPPEKPIDAVKEVPLGKPDINSNFDRFANNSFEKKGHPATSVLNAMLQQRQMQGERNRVENTQSSDSASIFSRVEITGRKDETHRTQDLLDENSNEILRSVWNQSEDRLRNKSTDDLQDHKKRFSETSDQVFIEREVTERLEYHDGVHPPQSYTAREVREVNISGGQPNMMTHSKVAQQERVLPGNENPPQYHEVVPKTAPGTLPNVIQRETAEELRQKVLAESRPPSTPKSVRVFGFGSQATRSEADRTSLSGLATRNSVTTNDVSSYTQPTRISMNNPNTSSLYSPTSSRWYRRGYSYGRSEPGSPYKWQVQDIDTHREYREPDARSNESKLSGTGSTVRRHVPRGRIRDLARLFDKMTREAEREAAVLRGKSLPPPKHRSKFTRTRSMPRPQDLLAREEELRREEEERNRGPVLRELPIIFKSNQDGASDIHGSNTNQQQYVSLHKNSGGDAPEPVLPNYGHGWSRVPCTGLEPGMMHPHNDDKESTDSRVDLRRTSTPLDNRGDGLFVVLVFFVSFYV
ncbi:hypothetical protein ANCCEY_06716 [Ancylostoma ceylanicum]|uniref:Uncharacterized protein n=1 Tax=Ancylostoma ceylanicum TaxID=53326 RepID=A0A0D6M2U4_9BILA|nr:hypothetical protein ANCCEY_06716 [Ancylostoma ceylanicum]